VRKTEKKELMVVALIFISVLLGFVLFSNSHAEIIREIPAVPTNLDDSDFILATSSTSLVVGESTRDEAMLVFPGGSDLGRSGVYRIKDGDCLLTFTKYENVLVRVDIGLSDLATTRGIKVNDSFDKVIEKYGNGFAKAFDKQTPNVFDAYYGSDRYLLFKVADNFVTKIYIGSPINK
jgi:hypothetical protein